jgi:hypothetical protein
MLKFNLIQGYKNSYKKERSVVQLLIQLLLIIISVELFNFITFVYF